MNLPKLPSTKDAHLNGLVLGMYLRRALRQAPALAWAFVRGLCGR
jgi:hypothetical protein